MAQQEGRRWLEMQPEPSLSASKERPAWTQLKSHGFMVTPHVEQK